MEDSYFYVMLRIIFHLVLVIYPSGFAKYLNLEGFLEKSLKIRYALKSTGKSLKGLEMFLNSVFCRN